MEQVAGARRTGHFGYLCARGSCIPVQCQVHPWMKSYIAVFKHPYFAVTGANGSFDIKNLPPGTYTLEAWHEKFGVSDQTVTIGAKEAKTVTFSFKPATGGD